MIMEKLGFFTVIKLLGEGGCNQLIYFSLQLLNHLCESSELCQDTFCMMGIIPCLHRFSGSENSREILIEVAFFIG